MPNTSAGRVEVDIVLSSEGFDGRIFVQVLIRLVLYVVVKREDELRRALYLGSTDGLESVTADMSKSFLTRISNAIASRVNSSMVLQCTEHRSSIDGEASILWVLQHHLCTAKTFEAVD